MNSNLEDNFIIEEGQMNNSSKKNVYILLSFLVFVFVGTFLLWTQNSRDNKFDLIGRLLPKTNESDVVETFSSADDFLSYVNQGSGLDYYGSFGLDAAPTLISEESAIKNVAQSGGEPSRVSETNVQVLGVDEPDIVKTDGEYIFNSINRVGLLRPVLMRTDVEPSIESLSKIVPPNRNEDLSSKIIKAFPPSELEEVSEINETGNLLLKDDMLVVFESDAIVSYDVSDTLNPEKSWEIGIEDNTRIKTVRLLDGNIYVITSTYLDLNNPCPLLPITIDDNFSIACSSIYHPRTPIQTDVTYTGMKIDLKTGSVTENISFVGSSNSSVVYMSKNFLYVTYTTYEDRSEFMYDFFNSLGDDLVSNQVKSDLKRLSGYDLSSQAKSVEIQNILGEYYRSLSNDERRRIENEIADKMSEYATEKMREMEKTGIVKISLDDMSINSVGRVPGHPLNQFSLDEYKNNLRIAISVGGNRFGGSESANDVYVLDDSLKVSGKVVDLGIDERIYSARFIGDLAYLVTFKQIDPFYILDLSNPNKPIVKGELKIPGFSSYLHPLSENLILGVGREESQVKLSVFDVSKPTEPKELDKYLMDEYYSDVSNTHHAFLHDSKNKIFFLPAGQDGYVFSYEDGLSLEKVVTGIGAKRAVFIDNFLYILGDQELVVLDESDWSQVGNLDY